MAKRLSGGKWFGARQVMRRRRIGTDNWRRARRATDESVPTHRRWLGRRSWGRGSEWTREPQAGRRAATGARRSDGARRAVSRDGRGRAPYRLAEWKERALAGRRDVLGLKDPRR